MKKIKFLSSERSFIMSIALVAFVVVAIICVTQLYEIKARRERLIEENRQLNAQKQVLIDKNNALLAQGSREDSDTAYIEDVARNQLDMVYPGEIIFRTTGE